MKTSKPRKAKTASSKRKKGRRCCAETKILLHAYAPHLQDGDITVTPSGVTGPDLHLSPKALETYPFVLEGKNQESISIWAALEQSESHARKCPERIPVLFFRRNKSELYVGIRAEAFLKLVTGVSRAAPAPQAPAVPPECKDSDSGSLDP